VQGKVTCTFNIVFGKIIIHPSFKFLVKIGFILVDEFWGYRLHIKLFLSSLFY